MNEFTTALLTVPFPQWSHTHPQAQSESQGPHGRAVIRDNTKDAPFLSLKHSSKATSHWGSALRGAAFCFTPVPESTASFKDPSCSQVLRSLPHTLEGSQAVDRPSSSVQISPTDALSLEKTLFCQPCFPGQGRVAALRASSALCQGDWQERAGLRGKWDPLTPMAMAVPSCKSWEPAKPQTPRKKLHGKEEHNLLPWDYSLLPA